MKRKDGYSLHRVAEQNIIISENNVDFDFIITLNETGAFLWDHMEQATTVQQLAQALTEEYEVEPETAKADAEEFVQKMKELGLLE